MGIALARAKQDFEQLLREKIEEIPSPEEDKEKLYTDSRNLGGCL